MEVEKRDALWVRGGRVDEVDVERTETGDGNGGGVLWEGVELGFGGTPGIGILPEGENRC